MRRIAIGLPFFVLLSSAALSLAQTPQTDADRIAALRANSLALEAGATRLAKNLAGEPVAHYRYDGAAALNDLEQTPGDTDSELTKTKLCDPSFHTITARNVTQSQKKRICAAYGQTKACPGRGYEIDHLISIELGGANSDANLWPQPVDAAGLVGYHAKDKVENALHRAVCAGTINLPDAQACIARDWYACATKLGLLK